MSTLQICSLERDRRNTLHTLSRSPAQLVLGAWKHNRRPHRFALQEAPSKHKTKDSHLITDTKLVLVGDHWKSSFSFFPFCKTKVWQKRHWKRVSIGCERLFPETFSRIKNCKPWGYMANIPEWRDSVSLPPGIRNGWKSASSLGTSLKQNQLKLLTPGSLWSIPGMPVPTDKPKLHFSWCAKTTSLSPFMLFQELWPLGHWL